MSRPNENRQNELFYHILFNGFDRHSLFFQPINGLINSLSLSVEFQDHQAPIPVADEPPPIIKHDIKFLHHLADRGSR